MLKRLNPYFVLILVHLLIALAIYIVPFLSKIYGLCILFFGFILLLKTKNDKNQALVICAYIVSSEVFLRMTGGNSLHEIAKYEVIVFLLMGMFYKGFSKYAFIYWIFLMLLIPGVIIGAVSLGYKVDVRKAIAFNIMGEITLFIAAVYCFKRKVTFNEMGILFKTMILPLISTVTYLFLYTPSIKDVVTGTQSNFETSGGFGPNQVSTILGLGMFCFFVVLLLYSKSKKEKIFHFLFLLFVSYRAIVTFSRGGVFTGIVMILFLLLIVYLFSNRKNKYFIVCFFWQYCSKFKRMDL